MQQKYIERLLQIKAEICNIETNEKNELEPAKKFAHLLHNMAKVYVEILNSEMNVSLSGCDAVLAYALDMQSRGIKAQFDEMDKEIYSFLEQTIVGNVVGITVPNKE